MIPEWELWWCCLSDGWRGMFNWMGTFAPPSAFVYLREFYDVQFSYFIAPKDSWLYDWFNTNFLVTFGEVEVTPGVFVEYAYWDAAYYLSFQLWHLDAKYACPDPCKYRSDPFELP